jgi:transcriptional regulator with XRE-family HTH domain
MPAITSPASRFPEFRERAGLSHDEAAVQMGISSPSVWDVESHEDELSSCYSPSELRRFAGVLGVRPVDFFGAQTLESPVSATELVRLIYDQCRSRGASLEQFDDVVGWRLNACVEPPERLLEDISIDSLQWLCRELGIDWHRVILSL